MLLLLSAFSQPASANSRFEKCAQYDELIQKAVKKHFPQDFQYPLAWKAQLYQESLCDADAYSHAGAQGLAQIMPGTQRSIEVWKRVFFDPYDPADSINYGAYYQSRKMRTWNRRGRTPLEVFELGWASYNSGTGNVLKAQKRCGNVRLWSEILDCQSLITGHHAKETIGYVEAIKKWWKQMAWEELPPELRR